jgi:putative transposase
LSSARQRRLVGIYYHEPLGTESEENLAPTRAIGRPYLKRPFYGAPRTTDRLGELGFCVNRKRVERPNRAWCAEIAYVPMRQGYLYLVAVMDRLRRYAPFWELSNTSEAAFRAEALSRGRPDIFNTDQGSQFTAERFAGCLERARIKIGVDGRGRERWTTRWWSGRGVRRSTRTSVCPRDCADGTEARSGLRRYFRFYNTERPHQGLGKRTPAEAHVA